MDAPSLASAPRFGSAPKGEINVRGLPAFSLKLLFLQTPLAIPVEFKSLGAVVETELDHERTAAGSRQHNLSIWERPYYVRPHYTRDHGACAAAPQPTHTPPARHAGPLVHACVTVQGIAKVACLRRGTTES